MAGVRTIAVRFTGDATDLNRAANESGQHVSKWTTGMKQFGVAAAAAATAAGVALFQFARKSVDAFVESEQAQAKLNDAFARFPALADTNIARLQTLNTELARKTRFDDDATASGQAVLAQFQLTGTQLEQLTPLLQDFAAKTGKDLPSAAEDLGKALLGQGRALKEVGIDFEDAGSVGENFTNLTAALRQQVGGFAEQEGKTAAGQAEILKNQWGELEEQAGEKLLPALIKLAEIGLKVVDWASKNKEILIPLIAVIAAVTIAQWAWNVAMTANPIGLIIVGIAALVAAIVWVATKTTFFQDVWNASWGWIKRTAVDVWEWLRMLPERIGSVFSTIADFITAPFRAAFNFIADAWNNTIGKLSWSVPSWVPVIGGNTISVPQLRKFHSGGIVPGLPGSEMIGILQAGEQITPAGQSTGGGTTVIVYVDGVKAVQKFVKDNGGVVQVALGR